ncbi:MAG: hypothetical protein J0L99_18935 [Chitinophagales bacterium]|nr:hypothetical protein [Chitinophagales bacterium]
MSLGVVLLCALLYVGILFATAWRVDALAKQGKSRLMRNPYVYSLSLAVYCTAWTYYGSVGRASASGLSFLAIYLGPAIIAPLWYFLLRKMIVISKNQRINSIADFISARYGKSGHLATLVTIIALFGVIPYISIQLKAVSFSIDVLTEHQYPYFKPDAPLLADATFWVMLAMAVFTMLFGARKLDPNERHEGLIAAVAFESLVKLIAFWVVGLFVIYGLYNGLGDLFTQAAANPETARLFSLSGAGVSPTSWTMYMLLSALAIMLLPRQFHVAVVENTHPRQVNTAMWLFPLYLLLINFLVLPIALAGKMILGSSAPSDTYVLTLPIHEHLHILSLIVFIGGFSAATSMVIVSSTAISIMVSNHLVLPMLIRLKLIGQETTPRGASTLLDVRRVSILGVLMLALLFLKSIGGSYDLVSVGLISFTAVAQFAPSALFGMYWRRGTRKGAIAGLWIGFLIWAYCLPAAAIAEAGFLSQSFITDGPWGISSLRPYHLFGMEGMDNISHAAFWSLLLNTGAFLIVSLYTQPSALELTQANIFVNIHRYVAGEEYDVVKRAAKISDLHRVMGRFLDPSHVSAIFSNFEKENKIKLDQQKNAEPELINYAETQLAGIIGASSARLAIGSVAKEENITLEEVMQVLEQTREVLRYSKALEQKSSELETTTRQLIAANEQLKALDRLKADFITTVTHELRTPVTSIKALSKILLDYRAELPEEKLQSYLNILVSESERISRLINQVLDIEKIESGTDEYLPTEPFSLDEIVRTTAGGMAQLFRERSIEFTSNIPEETLEVAGNRDRIVQVVVNLLSNALKFCDAREGRVSLSLQKAGSEAVLRVADNGKGIPPEQHVHIFDKFTQLNSKTEGKPQGTGLGLYITRKIVEHHGGSIKVMSAVGAGATFEVRLPIYPSNT